MKYDKFKVPKRGKKKCGKRRKRSHLRLSKERGRDY